MSRIPILEFRNVNKWFDKVHALKDVSFKIYEGEIMGLIGDNGAGKSTLIKIISGVIPYEAGEIYWNGEKLKNYSIKKARKLGIETAFQDKSLIDCFNVSQNIFLSRGMKKRFLGIFKILDLKRMNEESSKVLQYLRLSIPPTQEVNFCSGGERQGVVISRTIYFKSKLVILDEPTRALSIAAIKQIQEFVIQLKKQNIACIFITHNLHHVYSIADRFVVLAKGMKILEKRKENVTLDELEESIINATVVSQSI